MPRSGTLLEAAISFYGQLANDAVAQFQQTQEELRTDQFSIEKTLGRALSLWLDSTEGLLNAILVTANEPLPTIFLRVTPRVTTVGRSVNVKIPNSSDFSRTMLRQIGGDASIPDANFRATPEGTPDSLNVKLVGLDQYRPEPGLYQSLAYSGDKPLAIILVQVEPNLVDATRRTTPRPAVRKRSRP